jgi:bla regulator protein BlaR1
MMISQLADHLWHSTVFTCVVALLTLMLRRNRAALRHGLWMTASVKFLIPFSLLIGIGREVGWRNVPAIEQPRIEIVEQVSEPFALQASSPVTHSAPNPTSAVPAILFGVWLCGFAAHSLAWWRRWQRVRTALRAASPSSLNLATKAMFGPAHLEPGVFGILNPVLLLPQGITERLTPAQFDAIIAHELCHVRRRDNLAAAIHMVVEALFWFHPLVWWIERRLVEERERACDEEVLRTAIDPQDYAEGIVNVCRLYLEAPLVCISGVTGADLKQRVEAIMANRSASRLNFGRKLLLATAGIIAVAGPVTLGILTASRIHAQAKTAAPVPKFDVASIRPCENNDPVPGVRSGAIYATPNRLHVRCVSLGFLIQAAYVTFGSYGYAEVSGGPAWMHSDQFNIEAKTTGNPSARTIQGPMLQALLEDRFKLRIRREIREVPVYNLNVSKGGFKLQPMKAGSCVDFDFLNADSNARADLKATIASLEKSCNRGGFSMRLNPAKAEFHGMTLDTVATSLSRPASGLGPKGPGLGRPVINKTGITGVFDFEFEFSPEQAVETPGDAPSEPSGAPSIFTALEKAAGLKLDRAKGPGTFFVIEAAERPSEN